MAAEYREPQSPPYRPGPPWTAHGTRINRGEGAPYPGSMDYASGGGSWDGGWNDSFYRHPRLSQGSRPVGSAASHVDTSTPDSTNSLTSNQFLHPSNPPLDQMDGQGSTVDIGLDTTNPSAVQEWNKLHRWGLMTRTIAHYRRLEQIGEGTYGQVYRAQRVRDGRVVALKKIRVHHGSYQGLPSTVIREIKILKELRHPNMVELIEVLTSKGVECLDEDDEREDERRKREKAEKTAAEKEIKSLAAIAPSNSVTVSLSGNKSNKKISTIGSNGTDGIDESSMSPSATDSVVPKSSAPEKRSQLVGRGKLVKGASGNDHRESFKGNLFIVLEYVSHDLTGLMDMCYRFTEVQVKCIFHQLLQVLDYIHENKYVHRDLKCSNILITHRFRLKLADFGLARSIDDTSPRMYDSSSSSFLSSTVDRNTRQHGLELTNKVITLWYRPPELLLGETRYGTSVDMWSAGCILAELLMGRPILPGKSDVEQLGLTFDLVGSPTDKTWEGFSSLKLIKSGEITVEPRKSNLRSKFGGKMNMTAIYLVEKLLELDPVKRMTAGRALMSRYFITEPRAPANPEDLGVINLGSEYGAAGDGNFHEFRTKKRRREAKALAEKARKEAKTQGMSEKEVEASSNAAYEAHMKRAAAEGFLDENSENCTGGHRGERLDKTIDGTNHRKNRRDIDKEGEQQQSLEPKMYERSQRSRSRERNIAESIEPERRKAKVGSEMNTAFQVAEEIDVKFQFDDGKGHQPCENKEQLGEIKKDKMLQNIDDRDSFSKNNSMSRRDQALGNRSFETRRNDEFRRINCTEKIDQVSQSREASENKKAELSDRAKEERNDVRVERQPIHNIAGYRTKSSRNKDDGRVEKNKRSETSDDRKHASGRFRDDSPAPPLRNSKDVRLTSQEVEKVENLPKSDRRRNECEMRSSPVKDRDAVTMPSDGHQDKDNKRSSVEYLQETHSRRGGKKSSREKEKLQNFESRRNSDAVLSSRKTEKFDNSRITGRYRDESNKRESHHVDKDYLVNERRHDEGEKQSSLEPEEVTSRKSDGRLDKRSLPDTEKESESLTFDQHRSKDSKQLDSDSEKGVRDFKFCDQRKGKVDISYEKKFVRDPTASDLNWDNNNKQSSREVELTSDSRYNEVRKRGDGMRSSRKADADEEMQDTTRRLEVNGKPLTRKREREEDLVGIERRRHKGREESSLESGKKSASLSSDIRRRDKDEKRPSLDKEDFHRSSRVRGKEKGRERRSRDSGKDRRRSSKDRKEGRKEERKKSRDESRDRMDKKDRYHRDRDSDRKRSNSRDRYRKERSKDIDLERHRAAPRVATGLRDERETRYGDREPPYARRLPIEDRRMDDFHESEKLGTNEFRGPSSDIGRSHDGRRPIPIDYGGARADMRGAPWPRDGPPPPNWGRGPPNREHPGQRERSRERDRGRGWARPMPR